LQNPDELTVSFLSSYSMVGITRIKSFLDLLSIGCEVDSAALQPVPFLTVLAVLGVALGTLLVISSAGRTIYLYLALLKA